MKRTCVCAIVVASLMQPALASADAWISPYVGTLFGGSSGRELSVAVEDRSDVTYGISVGGMGAGVFGAELDVAYTPKFFGSEGPVDSSNVATIHGSLLLGIPIGGQSGGGIRPYGVLGIGLMRRAVEFGSLLDDISTNDFGYNVGFGVMAFLGDVFGVRGEYRYFRNFQKDDEGFFTLSRGTFHFSRATAGIVLRF